MEAPAVTDANFDAGFGSSCEHAVGVDDTQRDRFFHQHRLAKLYGLQHRLEVLALAGGDDHGRHLRIVDDRQIIVAVRAAAGELRELFRVGRIQIRHRDAADRRMPGGEARAQCADTPGPDDAEPDVARFFHARHLTRTGIGAGPPSGMPTRPAAITDDTMT